ncbi:histidinol phosphate phosphatase domain-containing protein [Metabacillus arenae]|uniref:Histidinol-phosphatase n=1 Tax=Metabacillus arenae TaxID=2771434 RepID=A0A926RYF3_9BACI|nr:histidinol phosphate phosphatase domain-containing protein [Metabacillus arenae]MBD1382863.1 histidinol phosphate phosphatase domain-containing protein [Metabacillus arenae]
MKVDYHVHLEEGPYSFKWLERTSQTIHTFSYPAESRHTIKWMKDTLSKLNDRVHKGAYDSSWLDLYLESAKRKGIREVGIVDHLYRFTDSRKYFETYMVLDESPIGQLQNQWLGQVMTERMDHFFEAVSAAKEKWEKQGILLRVGIEADYFENSENELKELLSCHDWDYINGSVHFLHGWGFDNPQMKDRFEKYDLNELYQHFFRIVEKGIRSGLFDFMSHLDNLKVFGYRPHEESLIPSYKRIVKALKEMDVATEVNAGLYYRFPVKEMCPSKTFLNLLLEENVPVTLSSDAHFPDDLGAYASENAAMLVEKGIREIATFKKRERIMKPLRLLSEISTS